MALPSTKPISLSQIKAEFGSDSLKQNRLNAGLSENGTMSAFLGMSSETLSLTLPATVSAYDPEYCTFYLYIQQDGTWRISVTGTSNQSGTWLEGGNAGDYEVKVTKSGTATFGGTYGVWLDIGLAARTFSATNGNLGTRTANFLVEIRKKSDISKNTSDGCAVSLETGTLL